jgi:GNAT superfamily N-acetyltransferase
VKLSYTLSPDDKDIGFLTKKINEETVEKGTVSPFAFFIRDDRGDIVGGCNGFILYGAIYTDQLWVHPDHRNSGMGRELMDQVHECGRANKCSMATVITMDFQGARGFYEHLGYECDFERPGYVDGVSYFFFKKPL